VRAAAFDGGQNPEAVILQLEQPGRVIEGFHATPREHEGKAAGLRHGRAGNAVREVHGWAWIFYDAWARGRAQ
jgi:hypothetical protein